jgi:hypothetical protein
MWSQYGQKDKTPN